MAQSGEKGILGRKPIVLKPSTRHGNANNSPNQPKLVKSIFGVEPPPTYSDTCSSQYFLIADIGYPVSSTTCCLGDRDYNIAPKHRT